MSKDEIKKKKNLKKHQNQINTNQKQEGQKSIKSQIKGYNCFFLKVRREFLGNEREESEKRKKPDWIQNWKPNEIKLNSK